MLDRERLTNKIKREVVKLRIKVFSNIIIAIGLLFAGISVGNHIAMLYWSILLAMLSIIITIIVKNIIRCLLTLRKVEAVLIVNNMWDELEQYRGRFYEKA